MTCLTRQTIEKTQNHVVGLAMISARLNELCRVLMTSNFFRLAVTSWEFLCTWPSPGSGVRQAQMWRVLHISHHPLDILAYRQGSFGRAYRALYCPIAPSGYVPEKDHLMVVVLVYHFDEILPNAVPIGTRNNTSPGFACIVLLYSHFTLTVFSRWDVSE